MVAPRAVVEEKYHLQRWVEMEKRLWKRVPCCILACLWPDRRCLEQYLLNERQRKPDVTQPEKGARYYAQFPGAFAPAKHLCCTIDSHWQDHQYPEPPGDARQALFAQYKGQAAGKHRAVNGEVASAHAQLVSENIK